MHGMSRWAVLAACGMERRAGDELAQSVEVAYDGAGRPVSYTDQDGRARKFERDAFGRVVKEIFPDATEVGYAYDGAGRLSSVLDENRHRIQFGWDAQGLASRATAAGQLTDYVRDDYGLLKEVVSSRDGKADRTVKREYDKFDRVAKVVYGPGEVETFAYDAWGRLAKHTRGKKVETYVYDYFGRLVEKNEDGVATSYAYDAWGQRTRRVTKDAAGIVSEETRTYDKFGRLAEIASSGKRVAYVYDRAGRVARQVVDGRAIAFEYTKYGRLAAKTLLGVDSKTAEVRYRYGKDGKIVARRANGVLQNYAYDPKGQLVAVTGEDGTVAERYAYDPAGNILEKGVGGKVTKYAYDGANQLVSSTAPDGTVTKYAYDAAGRMVKEGSRTYRYGYLDKVLSVIDGKERRTFTYHVDGQLATATRHSAAKAGGSRSRATETGRAASPLAAAETETFLWDGLALIQRGSTSYVNEPHPNGGSPVLSSSDGVMFNDVLGTTLGIDGADGYAATSLTAFGDPASGGPRSGAADALFTGKPHVDGLGYAFLFRNYRPALGKWLTADPLGYPDGWNQLAYCKNGVTDVVDYLGGWVEAVHHDINKNWLESNSYSLNAYDWGGYLITVLDKMNGASDWTDSFWRGNQRDKKAYLHAMRRYQNQSFQEAAGEYYNYLSECARNARNLADRARNAYAHYADRLAVSLLYEAIHYVGCIVHTFSDSFSPSHSGFQYFSLWDTFEHIAQENMDVYTSNNGAWRKFILNELNQEYLSMLRYVLRQPYRE